MIIMVAACERQVLTEEPKMMTKPSSMMNGQLEQMSVPGGEFFRGADISGLARLEGWDSVYYNALGNADDCLNVLKEEGINAVRLKVWVDAIGYASKQEVASMAQRANNKGLKVMIDFHLSHTWADKDYQKIPPSWLADSGNIINLGNRIYNHVYGMLDTLRTLGITPEWVQVGNESDKGILNPVAAVNFSSTANYNTLATLSNRGYDAVKAINTSIKVIVHLSDVSTTQARFYFDNFKANGGKFDMIGFSVYPSSTTWQGHINGEIGKFKDMNSRYGVPAMICEIGMSRNQPLIARDALTMMMDKSRTVTGLGVPGMFYWEPQSLTGGGGAFANGRPLATMDAYQNDMLNEAGQVTNYSFEANGTGTQTPTGWTTNSLTGTFNADYTDGSAFLGSYKLSHWSNSAYQVSTHQLKTGLTNGTYRLSAWVRSSGGQTTCQLFAKDFGSSEKNINLPNTNEWKYIEISNIVVSNGKCDFGLRSNSPANKWASMDDVAFYKTN